MCDGFFADMTLEHNNIFCGQNFTWYQNHGIIKENVQGLMFKSLPGFKRFRKETVA